jgi:A/G-specific adenine glycosylase
VHQTTLLILQNGHGEVLLERRPPSGIWGGLWSLPECPPDAPVAEWCAQHLGYRVHDLAPWPVFRHTFSHFHLDATPIHGRVEAMTDRIADGGTMRWLAMDAAASGGLAAPIRRLIDALKTSGDPNDTHGLLREVGQTG